MDYKNNRYLDVYRQHYRPQESPLAPASCERLLAGLVHVQELFNRAVEDLAELLAGALRVPPPLPKQKSVRRPPPPAPTVPRPDAAQSQRSRLLSQAFVHFAALPPRVEAPAAAEKTSSERERCPDCRRFDQSTCSSGKGLAEMPTQGCARHRRERAAFETPQAT